MDTLEVGLGHIETSRVVDTPEVGFVGRTPRCETSRVVDTPEVDFVILDFTAGGDNFEEIHIINTSGLRKSAIIAMFC